MIEKKEKKITNLELLKSINRSFSKVEARMATKEDLRKLETKMATLETKTATLETKMATKNDLKKLEDKLVFRIDGLERRIDDYAFNKVGYDNFSPLVKRVEKLEKV